ncbi:MAG: BrxE family protein [Acidobacteriia bacterium]|nr:BrxE family protein [Terriglobia bacterium]
MALEMSLLLRYRLAIARLGERDLFHWWESSALTEEGRYALGRLFRHTSFWTAIHLAMEAARARHEAVVPAGARVTLFNLGDEIEQLFDVWLSERESANGTEILEIPAVPEGSRGSVREALAALQMPIEEPRPKTLGDRAIQVADVRQEELRSNTLHMVRLLLATYTRSDRERLLAPYITLRAPNR